MTLRIIGSGSELHSQRMRALGTFLGLAEISYVDHGNRGEDYTFVRDNGEKLTIRVRSNPYDGAFLTVDGAEPLT